MCLCCCLQIIALFFFSNNEIVMMKADTSSETKDIFGCKAMDSDSAGL